MKSHGMRKLDSIGAVVVEKYSFYVLLMDLWADVWNDSLIEAVWRIYASVKHTNIVWNNGLSPVRRQAIIWTNATIMSITP